MPRKRTRQQLLELDEDIRNMINAGMIVADIASELGISAPYVYLRVRTMGIDTTGKRTPGAISHLTDEEMADIVDKWLNVDNNVQDILVDHALTYGALYTIIKRHGVPADARRTGLKEVREAQMETAIALYIDGASYATIREETGVWQPVLSTELRRRKIPMKRQVARLLEDDDPEVLGRVLRDPTP